MPSCPSGYGQRRCWRPYPTRCKGQSSKVHPLVQKPEC